jgi:hypothetical protein
MIWVGVGRVVRRKDVLADGNETARRVGIGMAVRADRFSCIVVVLAQPRAVPAGASGANYAVFRKEPAVLCPSVAADAGDGIESGTAV